MNDELLLNKSTIHFIYPFLPAFEEGALNEKDLKDFVECAKFESDCTGGYGKPASRNGLSVYLALKLDMAYLELPVLTGRVDNIKVSIEPLVRIFPLASTCSFKLTAENKVGDNGKPQKLNTSDIHKLLHLVSQKRNKEAEFKITEIDIDFYKITDVDRQEYNIKEGEITLFKLFSIITTKLTAKFNNNNKRKNQEKKLALYGKAEANNDLEEYQCPSVISVIEVEGEVHDAFCHNYSDCMENPLIEKYNAIKKYEHYFAPMLYRSVMGEDFNIEPCYSDLNIDGKPAVLHNMNLDARLFVQSSRRSILCLCKDQNEDPAAYFLPNLLDLCEMLHARSHSLVIFNKILDHSLKNFTNNEMTANKRLHKMISIITRFISCLEDPSTYVISGDALREIHEKMIDSMRIPDLRENVLKKIDMMERLYKYRLQLRWTDDEEQKTNSI